MVYEYLPGDKELFDMLDRKKPTERKTVGIVVPVKRAQELEKLEQLEQLILRIQNLGAIVCAALVAAIFFAAAILGWMDITFGTIATLIAAARAIALYWRYRHGRK